MIAHELYDTGFGIGRGVGRGGRGGADRGIDGLKTNGVVAGGGGGGGGGAGGLTIPFVGRMYADVANRRTVSTGMSVATPASALQTFTSSRLTNVGVEDGSSTCSGSM